MKPRLTVQQLCGMKSKEQNDGHQQLAASESVGEGQCNGGNKEENDWHQQLAAQLSDRKQRRIPGRPNVGPKRFPTRPVQERKWCTSRQLVSRGARSVHNVKPCKTKTEPGFTPAERFGVPLLIYRRSRLYFQVSLGLDEHRTSQVLTLALMDVF